MNVEAQVIQNLWNSVICLITLDLLASEWFSGVPGGPFGIQGQVGEEQSQDVQVFKITYMARWILNIRLGAPGTSGGVLEEPLGNVKNTFFGGEFEVFFLMV